MKEKFFLSFTLNILSNLMYLISGYLLALNLEVALLGLWVFLNSLVNLGFLFMDVGFDIIHYQYSGKKEFAKYFSTYFSLKLILLIFNVLFSLLLLFIFNFWISFMFLIFFLILLISKMFYYLSNIFLVHLRANLKIFKAETPSFIIISLKSFIIIILALNLSIIENPVLFLCYNNLFFDILLILIIVSLSKKEIKFYKPNLKYMRSYINDAKPLTLYSIILVISTYLGDVILDYSFGHETLAFFSIVNGYIIPVLLLISGSIITIYFSLFSKYQEEKNINSITQITRVLEKYYSIIFLFLIIFVFLNGNEMFEIFLPQYISSVPILYILIFIPYIVGISRPYPYILISGKKQGLNAKISTINSLSIIFLMIILIPEKLFLLPGFGLGAIGYALAQTLPWILWSILNRYHVYKYFGIKMNGNLFIHVLMAIATFFTSYFIKQVIRPYIMELYSLVIISSCMELIIFLILLFVFKQLNKDDIKLFMELIKLKIYMTSFKDEFKQEN
ncbi:MAG: lipopolysaccharide biosynthesis protein [Promethearchaeota archaeon]